MKKLSLLTFLLFSVAAFSQRSPIAPTIRKLKNDTIIWKKDSLLRQTDFKAKPRSNGPLGLSAVGILYYFNEANGELLFSVEALFVKSKSYLVKNTDYVLKHEQTHFDITELYARTLRKRFSEINFKKVKSLKGETDKIYEKLIREYSKEQNSYDGDTEHGLNAAKQKVWNEDISRRLAELDKFSALEVPMTN